MLKIRRFVQSNDAQTWVNILNAAYGQFGDWRTLTVDEFLNQEQAPDLLYDGRWIGLIDDAPVGVLRTFTRKTGEAVLGYMDELAVAPSSAGLNVEISLARFGIRQLRKQGVERILVPRLRWSGAGDEHRALFLEKLGFKLTRTTSLMEMDLKEIPIEVSRDKRVIVQPSLGTMKDVETLSWLRNECSKEQFNYRPTTLEETQYLLEHCPYAYLEVFFAMLEKHPVGYLVVAIDDKFNVEKNVQAGILLAVGVLKQRRRQGIGSALTHHGLKVLKAKQMTRAFLDVDDLNQTGALKLYEKLGFKVSEKYLTYENSIESLLS